MKPTQYILGEKKSNTKDLINEKCMHNKNNSIKIVNQLFTIHIQL